MADSLHDEPWTQQLQAFALTEPSEEYAKPVSVYALNRADEVLGYCADYMTDNPTIAALPKGELLLRWSYDDVIITIEFTETGHVALFYFELNTWLTEVHTDVTDMVLVREFISRKL